jgi:glycosyltransferase involved in cell wall biosynthesis
LKKLVVGITAPLSIVLLEGQLKHFGDQGFEVYLMAPETLETIEFCKKENCALLPVDIVRDISLKKDIIALIQIIKHFIRIKPDIVNVGTPKMGLLGTIGSYLTKVKKRIYTCRGFRYEHEKGLKRKILLLMEKITARLAHQVICISPSVKNRGIQDNIFKENKAILFGMGSSNGLNVSKFSKAAIDNQRLTILKKELGIERKFVFGFVGRIIDRKGIKELFEAFYLLHEKHPEVFLIIVGKANPEQVSDPNLIRYMENHPAIYLADFQTDIPLYLSLFDVFVLPAWWEGFGNTLIQAAAMGLPVISTKVTGCMDAVSDRFNGILINSKSTQELTNAMESLLINSKEKIRLGKNGLIWSKSFDSDIIWKGLEKLYNQ